MNRKGFISFFVLLGVILACVIPLGLSPTDVVITQIVVVPNEQQAQPAPTQSEFQCPCSYGYNSPHSSSCEHRDHRPN